MRPPANEEIFFEVSFRTAVRGKIRRIQMDEWQYDKSQWIFDINERKRIIVNTIPWCVALL